MFRRADSINGVPVRIYRTPAEIRGDISRIKEKIGETVSMLNIRSILVEILSDSTLGSPEKLIPELEYAISEAGDALRTMKELDTELKSLKLELREVIDAI